MNFDNENTFDLNELVDHLEDSKHAAPSDGATPEELYEGVWT